ncbi:hypothetical protein ROHU_007332 [Labeo rohita]|uniref:Uncharacterized protein n=1 Tax=Labeo rohita TaxID=84645 RepID=A0A498MQH7_LABRO|nr:hypothetical protein ROHU_007332 [Labeo rohita]
MIRSGGSERSDGPEPHEEQRAEESERRSRGAGEPHECDVQTRVFAQEDAGPDLSLLNRRRGVLWTQATAQTSLRDERSTSRVILDHLLCEPNRVGQDRTGQDRRTTDVDTEEVFLSKAGEAFVP